MNFNCLHCDVVLSGPGPVTLEMAYSEHLITKHSYSPLNASNEARVEARRLGEAKHDYAADSRDTNPDPPWARSTAGYERLKLTPADIQLLHDLKVDPWK